VLILILNFYSSFMSYKATYDYSLMQPENFWINQAQELSWYKQPKIAISKNKKDFYQWFEDGELNLSYLCLDYHVNNGNGNQTAIIHDSPVTNTVKKYSYLELRNLVSKFAGGLISQGIKKGDTVIIYMPMIPQSVIAMLACARIGAIHSVVFGGFASHELALRIDDCRPKAIITASYGIEIEKVIMYPPLVKQAIDEAAFKPPVTILFKRINDETNSLPDAIDYDALLNQSSEAEAISLLSTDSLYVLYTSGTTGKPKGVLRDTGGYATALKFSMQNIYNTNAGDVFFAASDLGWVVGHSFIVYGPLIQGCTTVLYEGKPVKTPDAGAFWRLISDYKIKTMFTAPTAIRAIKKDDPDGECFSKYDISSLQSLFLAGERCDITTYQWIKNILKRPIIDHWWQTESGWPMLGIMTGLEAIAEKPGSAGLPICGYDIRVLDEDGDEVEDGKTGLISVKLPLPPGCLTTLWNNDERFVNGYLSLLPGYYTTGDEGYKDTDGYFFILGRVDDVINVAGHRLSTGEMEEIISSHHSIAECAVVGISDELRGQRPLAFVVLKDFQIITESELENELIALIREKIGAVAFFKNSIHVKRLPKTRSGKILRKTLRDLTDNTLKSIPSTIEDISVLDEISEKLNERQLIKNF
jgi:acyl-coenzyme A synthetase/AMP-(fatty) acid ligase